MKKPLKFYLFDKCVMEIDMSLITSDEQFEAIDTLWEKLYNIVYEKVIEEEIVKLWGPYNYLRDRWLNIYRSIKDEKCGTDLKSDIDVLIGLIYHDEIEEKTKAIFEREFTKEELDKYRELEDLEADFIEKNDLLEAGNDKKVIDYLYTIDHKGHKDIWC